MKKVARPNVFKALFLTRVKRLFSLVLWVILPINAEASSFSTLANLPTSPLGNQVAISCHNCYNGPNNGILGLNAANNKINQAISRGANLIEIDIALNRANSPHICASHESISNVCKGNQPTLSSLLDNRVLQNSTAALFLEVTRIRGSDQSVFTTQFLDALLNYPMYATAQRPLYLRAFTNNVQFLTRIQAEVNSNSRYAPLRNHIRYSVLYIDRQWGTGNGGSITNLHSLIKSQIKDNNFHIAEFNLQIKDLLGAVRYAKSLGLNAGVFTVPSANGDALTAALRSEVDQITTEYRVDFTRQVITERNQIAYLNAGDCHSAFDSQVNYRFNYAGGSGTVAMLVDQPPSSTRFGTPKLWEDGVGEDRFSCSLDFRRNQSLFSRALSMGDRDNTTGEGFLVTAYVNFDRLSNLPEGTMALVNKSEGGGFALELANSGGSVKLRFGVHVNGAYRYKNYTISNTGLGGRNNSINGSDGYFLVGAYDGNGGLYLWVDNQHNGAVGPYSGTVTRNNADILIGADPQPSAAQGARFFFDGLIQQVSVLAWDDHSSGTN